MVTDLGPHIEGALGSSGVPPQDPFRLRVGVLSEEQIAGLRRRKKVAEYQKKQNNVCIVPCLFWVAVLMRLARSLYSQTDGGPHGGI